jgi:hypothetical protein
MSQPSDGTPRPTTTESPAPSANREHRDEDGKRKKKKKQFGNGHIVSSYVGKCEEIKNSVYDVTPGSSGFDSFARTTRDITLHIASTLKLAGEFCTMMDPESLGFPVLVAPADPDINNFMEIKRWEVAFNIYNKPSRSSSDSARRQ